MVPDFPISRVSLTLKNETKSQGDATTDGIKELQLFAGDDIFASHEE